ncbi:MAG TPA: hypothetical protein VGF94_08130 [Kofleriaceae bacterium]|jgi:hypothetical protein
MAAVEDPAPTDANLYVEDLAWPPPAWDASGEQVSTPEWAMPLPGSIQPPPPPAPPPPPQNPPSKPAPTGDKKLDEGTPALDEVPLAAGGGAIPSSPIGAVQPGIGIPTAMLDMFGAPPGQLAPSGAPGELPIDAVTGAAPATPGPQPPQVDAISGAAPLAHGSVKDELAAQGIDEVREGLPPKEQADSELADRLSQDPKALAKYLVDQDQKQRDEFALREKQALAEQTDRANANVAAYTMAGQTAKRKTDEDTAAGDVIAKTKVDPSLHLGVLGTLGEILASTLGGASSHWTGGQNWALQQWDQAVNNHIDAQKANLSNQWKALGFKQDQVDKELGHAGETFRTQEVQRLALYQIAKDRILTEMQNYDPRGSAVGRLAQLYAGIDGQAKVAQAASYERYYKIDKDKADAELARANAAKANAEAQQKLGTLGGGPTNNAYTVATGFFDPFNGAPIMGKQAIERKGAEGKPNPTEAQIATYGHVQDYWADMARIGKELGDAKKTMSESLYSKFKSTKAAVFDAKRHALVVYLTKEMGDRLTQGQIDEQVQRIPERASVFESRDPLAQITEAQESADRDFSRDMNVLGINAAPIIENARKHRADAPTPNSKDDLNAAQSALANARTPKDRADAQAELEAAQERVTGEVEHEQQGAAALRTVQGLEPIAHIAHAEPVPEVEAAYRARDEAVDTYNQSLAKFRRLQAEHAEAVSKKGAKIAPDDATHRDALQAAALEVMDAKRVIDSNEVDVNVAKKNKYHALDESQIDAKPEFH